NMKSTQTGRKLKCRTELDRSRSHGAGWRIANKRTKRSREPESPVRWTRPLAIASGGGSPFHEQRVESLGVQLYHHVGIGCRGFARGALTTRDPDLEDVVADV